MIRLCFPLLFHVNIDEITITFFLFSHRKHFRTIYLHQYISINTLRVEYYYYLMGKWWYHLMLSQNLSKDYYVSKISNDYLHLLFDLNRDHFEFRGFILRCHIQYLDWLLLYDHFGNIRLVYDLWECWLHRWRYGFDRAGLLEDSILGFTTYFCLYILSVANIISNHHENIISII